MYYNMKGLTTPSDRTTAWRYLDLPKLAAMLTGRSLYFSRLDSLEDKFEGMRPRGLVRAEREHEREVATWRSASGKPALKPRSPTAYRRAVAVSCWRLDDHEAMGMWKTYGSPEFGVAVRSSVGSLIASLANVPEHIYIAKIRYLDFEAVPHPEPMSLVEPAFWKQAAFSSEAELRCAVFRGHRRGHSGGFPSLGRAKGVNVPVDLDVLIEGIVVSPAAPRWYIKTVEAVVRSLNFDAGKVQPSALAIDPRRY